MSIWRFKLSGVQGRTLCIWLLPFHPLCLAHLSCVWLLNFWGLQGDQVNRDSQPNYGIGSIIIPTLLKGKLKHRTIYMICSRSNQWEIKWFAHCIPQTIPLSQSLISLEFLPIMWMFRGYVLELWKKTLKPTAILKEAVAFHEYQWIASTSDVCTYCSGAVWKFPRKCSQRTVTNILLLKPFALCPFHMSCLPTFFKVNFTSLADTGWIRWRLMFSIYL